MCSEYKEDDMLILQLHNVKIIPTSKGEQSEGSCTDTCTYTIMRDVHNNMCGKRYDCTYIVLLLLIFVEMMQ
jgi:hypothetical protein